MEAVKGAYINAAEAIAPIYLMLLTHVNHDVLQRSKLLKQFHLFMLLSWDVWS